ncbi:protein-export chaperone SecB [Chryseobacterium sp. AG844]|uniref:protein-export chaperone SecB n=1 Tax=Chryseobacterium sp. AG844 TaxID=2183998 RepID=UPI000D714A86|nr:protein-export chaperone SecB [Chryseobacterium sp. AG844]PWW25399.1 preprotein translocase subunit SecB [Chryseobacterium sp. AG844]
MKTELQNIILASTSFERDRVLNLEETYELTTEIEISHAFSRKKYLIVEFVYKANFSLNKKASNRNKITYNSKHVAQFKIDDFNEQNEEDLLVAERFANINAAAMIFPFIRENAATISAKAGMSPLIIPITNFVKIFEDKKQKEKQEYIKPKK